MPYKDNNVEMLTEVKKGEFRYGYLLENDGRIETKNDTILQMREDINNGHKFVCPNPFIVPAVFQKYNIQNANGRIYPEHVLRREVDKYIQERVNRRCAIGALDHPAQSGLSGHDVSHNIIELHWEGQTLLGKLELLLSPGFISDGRIGTSADKVATLLLHDILIGVSSRGLGSVKQMPDGTAVVDDDFSLICWDIVMEPSTPGAFIGDNEQNLKQYIENTQRNDISSKKLDERIIKIKSLLM